MDGNDKNNYVTLSVDIPYELKDKLKFLSYKEKRPIKDLVKEALEKLLKEESEV
ncbi:TPA: hypothetical protein KKX05_002718 [Legionella pneumophila]|nr:hypothetical protein [Legionella pneumophila]HAT7956365.1 hypothetical protein [Legionella pneumophila]HBD7206031.1 hypothetical protein [Legionella pneumophila]HBI2960120.1 hypothetical protein [Legionella pneumophila]HBP6880084.1 hypothetical protein [Legionella pneumophila]|tara:strand:+ start:284 stop:445 length:162 start_codon:yes stop_codon:yes gene_type:complete